ncbi:MAG: quinol dehydrogenase membrane component [Methanomassiliicoccales archaeon PtaU1.Bin124]|nr:MAG: quinol dehydrogenase membrane component [Methanomassiliicoccales archaeon PtaU1.Bin124]
MTLKSRIRTLKRGRWRYLSMFLGFFLIVAPFALIPRAYNYLTGSDLVASVHTICYRVLFAWISGPGPFLTDIWAATILVGIIMAVAFLFGPVFCGWICPVGAIGEALSRLSPIPNRFKLNLRDAKVTAGLRYGFFVGYLLVGVAIAQDAIAYQFGGITCRYCAPLLLEQGANWLFTGSLVLEPLTAGVYLVLLSWLFIGGLFMVGGRGWCLFFCPLGALSGLSHKLGARLGLYRIDHEPDNCRNCKKCQVQCTMMAIKEDGSIQRSLCIGCGECKRACVSHGYVYRRGGKK